VALAHFFLVRPMHRAILAMIVAVVWLLPPATLTAVSPSKRPESYTLSSWKGSFGHWDFSLVSKTYWYTAGSVAELKQQLSRLPAGTRIGWYTRPEIGFLYPPEPMFSDIRRFLSEHHFELVFMRAPRAKPKRPNHAMERTATRRAFTFSMIKPLSLRTTLALGGRRSSYSR
jgi:hypothetical protein